MEMLNNIGQWALIVLLLITSLVIIVGVITGCWENDCGPN